ncbi:MAG: hypothetical protein H6567_11400 [Lewinellaceae bacterium]|nr:hypothetical protein [Lewinellaceae bacterium]
MMTFIKNINFSKGKAWLLTLFGVFMTQFLFGQSSTLVMSSSAAGGIGVGSVIAIVASWSRNKSVLWAILHAILGWFYVIYFVLTR